MYCLMVTSMKVTSQVWKVCKFTFSTGTTSTFIYLTWTVIRKCLLFLFFFFVHTNGHSINQMNQSVNQAVDE